MRKSVVALRLFVTVSVSMIMGCGSPPRPRLPQSDGAEFLNPLGPSYVLVPAPNDDDALLGRILPGPPEPGHSLEETARPNPCAQMLSDAKTTPMSNSYEDAQDVTGSAKAQAMLGAFGFAGDAHEASHFIYRIETTSRLARTDTTEYEACCKEKGCGYGYISALIYGEGHYATGQETGATGGVRVFVTSAEGTLSLRTLHKRRVRGFVAAVVTVTDPSSGVALGPLGAAKDAGISETTMPEAVKQIYETEKLRVESGSSSLDYQLKDARGALTENEFVRRYRTLTGSSELDDFEYRRNTSELYAGWSLLGASAVSLGYLLSGPGRGMFDNEYAEEHQEQLAPSVASGVCLMMCTIMGGVFLGVNSRDGWLDDHGLSEREARLYVERYNRALLRTTARDVQRSHEQSTLESPSGTSVQVAVGPALSPGTGAGAGSIGLSGSF